MSFPNLSSFLSFLEKKQDLLRIKAEVDPVLEITEIATRVVKKGGPALLFENVKGSKFPAVINILGAERRVNWALGRSPDEVGEELQNMADAFMPPSLSKIWKRRSTLSRALSMRPKHPSSAPVLANTINPTNLEALPIAQSWPNDGGRFITFPLVVTKSPVDGRQNMGVYRMHLYGKSSTGMHWQIAKGGGYHYGQAEERGEALPLAAVVGADPILLMCGVLPLPEGLDEMSFAGFLRGQATKSTTVAGTLQVPSEAEFVLEGHVPPVERKMEGPYGDHFGHYSLAAPFPVFHVSNIYYRTGAIFPIAVVGKPPQEDQVIGDAVQKMLLPLLKIMHPEIVDLWAYQEAGFHNLLVVSVRQRFQKEAIKTALWVLGEGQLSLSKCVVLVDPDVNARNFSDVLKSVRKNFDPKEDFILLPGTSQDTLDFTSFKMNLGSKMILDATRSKSETAERPANLSLNDIKATDSRIIDAAIFENTMLVIQVKSDGRTILEKMVNFPQIRSLRLIAAVSSDVPLDNPTLMIWGLFTRFDCARDTFFGDTKIERGHVAYSGPLCIDATWKSGYPEPLSMDERTIEHVDKRWAEYGFGEFVPTVNRVTEPELSPA